jgi:hypothetical protein
MGFSIYFSKLTYVIFHVKKHMWYSSHLFPTNNFILFYVDPSSGHSHADETNYVHRYTYYVYNLSV